MSRGMILLGVLLVAMVVAGIVAQQQGIEGPSHMKCKESLVEQMLGSQCTPRRGVMMQPSQEGSPTVPQSPETAPAPMEGLKPRGVGI